MMAAGSAFALVCLPSPGLAGRATASCFFPALERDVCLPSSELACRNACWHHKHGASVQKKQESEVWLFAHLQAALW